MATDKPGEDPIIAQYQAQRAEMQPLWNRTIGLFMFPGVALSMLAISYDRLWWLAWIGVPLFLVGFVRAALLWREYKRCPRCGTMQFGGLVYPYRTCASCDARLSIGFKDSL